MIEYWAAISIGLLGSLHCVGMCGPISFALPLDRSNWFSLFTGSSLYQFGRLFTYMVLGILFGLFGKGLVLAGFQQWLSVSVGVIMVLSVFVSIGTLKRMGIPSFSLWLGKVKGELGKRFGRNTPGNLLTIGILNGLLPCGLVYMAIIGAIGMGNPLEGGLFMLAFGAGTIPLMLFIGVYGGKFQQRFASSFKKVIPVFIVLVGVLFIIRGLDLGIPYLSPELSKGDQIIKCH